MDITVKMTKPVYTVTMSEEELALVKTVMGRGVAWTSPGIGLLASKMYNFICDEAKVSELGYVADQLQPNCVPIWRACKY